MVFIVEVERYKIEEKLVEVKFCIIMFDGLIDVLVFENEIVYIYFVYRGVLYCYFFGLIECELVNLEGIYNVIKEVLYFKNIFVESVFKKIIVFVGDGVLVNIGYLNGVIVYFCRNVSLFIIMV